MSKKKLQVEQITNELEGGASLFFVKQSNSTAPQVEPKTVEIESVSPAPEDKPELKKEESVNADNHDPMNARMHSSTHAFKRDSMITNTGNNLKNDSIEAIRKSVKQVGKEEFYLRLTPAEKSEVAKVVYTFNELSVGEGRKISANEIGRIALHHLLIDYHENGEKKHISSSTCGFECMNASKHADIQACGHFL